MSNLFLPGQSEIARALHGWYGVANTVPPVPLVVSDLCRELNFEFVLTPGYSLTPLKGSRESPDFDLVGTVPRLGTPRGLGASFSGSSSNYLNYNPPNYSAGSYTKCVLFRASAIDGNNTLIQVGSPTGFKNSIWVDNNMTVSGNVNGLSADCDGTRRFETGSNVFEAGRWYSLVVNYNGAAGTLKAYANGVDIGLVQRNGTALPSTISVEIFRLGAPGTTLGGFNGDVMLAAFASNNNMTEATAIDLSRDLTRLLAPANDSPYLLVVPAGGGGTTAPITAASETDTSVHVTGEKIGSVATASETDAAQATAGQKTGSILPAAAADAAQSVTGYKVGAIGQATETNAAQAVALAGQTSIDPATETDTAQAVTGSKLGSISPTYEISDAGAVGRFQMARVVVTGPGAAGTTNVTSAGFGTPDAVIAIATSIVTGSSPQPDSGFLFGVWDGTNQYSVGSRSVDDQATSDTKRYQSSTHILANVAADTIAQITGTVTDGVSVDWVDGRQLKVMFLFIKAERGVTAFAKQLAGGETVHDIPLNHQPNGVVAFSVGSPLMNAGLALGSNCLGVGKWNGSSVKQAVVAFASANNANPASSAIECRDDAVAANVTDSAEVWRASMSVPDPKTLRLTTNTSVTGNDYVLGLAFELADPDGIDIQVVDTPTSTGNHDYTGMKRTPDSVVAITSTAQSVNALDTSAEAFGVGVSAIDSVNSYAFITASQNDVSPTNDLSVDGPYAIALSNSAVSSYVLSVASSLLSDGVRYNFALVHTVPRKTILFAAANDSNPDIPTTTGYKTGAITPATETDEAQSLTTPGAVSPATETTEAQPVAGQKVGSISPATEADSAQPAAGRKESAIASAGETDAPQTADGYKQGAITHADETDSAVALSSASGGSIDPATETSTAPSLSGYKRGSISPAVETASAQSITLFDAGSCADQPDNRLFDRSDRKRNASLLRVFGEPVYFPSVELTVTAIYVRGVERVPVGGLNPRESRDRIVCMTTDICAYNFSQGETVEVRGVSFNVVGVDPGINGMTSLPLRRAG